MNTVFTMEEKNTALEFAYAMGLTNPVKEAEETSASLDFANAMGLRACRSSKKQAARHNGMGFPVPALS